MSDFDQLVGKKVISVDITPEKTELRFNLEDSPSIVFDAYGDCCSSSWFESINGLDNLIGQVVYNAEEKEESSSDETDSKFDPKGDDREECIKIYGFTLRTDKGYTDIEMRNSSNGYYGGWIQAIKDAKDIEADLQPLTKDF